MASYNETTSELRTNKKLLFDTTADRVMTEAGITVEEALHNTNSNLGSHTHKASQLIQDGDNRFVNDAQIAKWDKGPLYTNKSPLIRKVGRFEEGTTFSNKTTTEMFNGLLYPTVNTDILSYTYPAPANPYRKGQSISLGTFTVNLHVGSAAVKNIVLCDGSNAIISNTAVNLAAGSTISKTITYSKTISDNYKMSLQIVDANNTMIQLDGPEYKFDYLVYYGSINPNTSISASNFSSLGLSSKISGKTNIKVTYSHEYKKAVFAYPESYGNIIAILDANGLDITNTFTKQVISVADITGNMNYIVYSGNPCTIANFEMRFVFEEV